MSLLLAAKFNPTWIFVGVLLVVFVAYAVWSSKSMKKREEERRKTIDESLRPGVEILTIGGIYGRVISLKEDTMVIESKADRSKLTIARWALQQNLTVHDDVAKK